MLAIDNVYMRVAKWMQPRCAREYSQVYVTATAPTKAAILADALEPEDKLKALVDLAIYSLAQLWKFKAQQVEFNHNFERAAEATQAYMNELQQPSEFLIPVIISDLCHPVKVMDEVTKMFSFTMIFQCAMTQLKIEGYDDAEINAAFTLVLDSHDTKAVVSLTGKNDSELKGDDYVCPKAKLKEISDFKCSREFKSNFKLEGTQSCRLKS